MTIKYLNALCDKLIKELNQALDDIENDNSLSVLVLTGSEKASLQQVLI